MKSFRRRLQIKGDPEIRRYLFEQERQESLFDQNTDRLIDICEQLLCERDAFHVKIHWSSSQLTVWNYTDPYEYQVHLKEEIFVPEFIDSFAPSKHWDKSVLTREEIRCVLETQARLRFTDKNVYVRACGINVINGMISMTFSCDGSHYIPFAEFDDTIKNIIPDV